MILVIGAENCSRCNMTKTILTNKKIKFEYQLLNSLPPEEQTNYLEIAEENNQMSFPLIFKDNELTTLQNL